MRLPIRLKRGIRSQVTNVISTSAPIGGWNARDSISEMKPGDAIRLENWFPRTTDCIIRGGYEGHATGITGSVKTLAVYNGVSGTNKMFAATSSGIYDVSSAGAVGASVATSTNGKWEHINFGDGTNNYLIMVNGVDKPNYYNGTTWVAVDGVSSPALTGLTTTNISGVMTHKGRLYFIEKSSRSFWYLAAGAAGGGLTEFDLSAEAPRGGYLIAMAAWTFDGGAGSDDYAVFVTSEGDVIVYQGNNPSVAANWAKVGSYSIGKPMGKRCLMKYGGDLLILTQNGVFQLSSALQATNTNARLAITNKIELEFNNAARLYSGNFGWEGINYPAQSALIFNIPVAEDGVHYQYVMNSITKSWCKFTAWDAETFAIFNGILYGGLSTKVNKMWSGTADGSNGIIADGKTAFNYFGSSSQKRFTMFRPVLQVNGSLEFLTDIDVDFKDDNLSGVASYSVTTTAIWDTSLWDAAYWSSGIEIVRRWTSPAGALGYCAAGKLKIINKSLSVTWIANDYSFERGGVL